MLPTMPDKDEERKSSDGQDGDSPQGVHEEIPEETFVPAELVRSRLAPDDPRNAKPPAFSP